MQTFMRTSMFAAAIGLSLGLLGSANAQLAPSTAKSPAGEKAFLPKVATGPDALDWSRFPLLRGKVSSAAGIFSSFMPPKAGDGVTIDAGKPKAVSVSFARSSLPVTVRTPFKVQEVFWDAKTGEFRGMRMVAADDHEGVKARYILDVYCPYKAGGENFQGRLMYGVLVEEIDGQLYRSTAGINLEFEGELPNRR